jgi:hypothetical protein
MGISPSSRGRNRISKTAAADGLDDVRMSRVRMVRAVRVHPTLGVRHLARSEIAIASTVDRVPGRKKKSHEMLLQVRGKKGTRTFPARASVKRARPRLVPQ